MPTIQSRDLSQPEPLRERDDRRVSRTERQVPVLPDETGRTPEVVGKKVCRTEGTVRHRVEERRLDAGTRLPSKQVPDFGRNRRRDAKFSPSSVIR